MIKPERDWLAELKDAGTEKEGLEALLREIKENPPQLKELACKIVGRKNGLRPFLKKSTLDKTTRIRLWCSPLSLGWRRLMMRLGHQSCRTIVRTRAPRSSFKGTA